MELQNSTSNIIGHQKRLQKNTIEKDIKKDIKKGHETRSDKYKQKPHPK